MNTSKIGILIAGLGLAANPALAGEGLGLDTSSVYAAELRADASTRGSLGPDVSEYAPKVFGYIQARYNFNSSDGYTGTSEDTYNGFEMGHTRLGVKGQIHSRVKYVFLGEFASDGGTFTLMDGYTTVDLNDDVQIQVGQFFLPYSRDFFTSPAYSLAAEKSVTTAFFPGNRAQGVMLNWNGERLRGHVMLSDGDSTANTAYTSTSEADYAVTGRVEWLAAGDWDQFNDFTSFRGSDFGALVGAAIHWQDGGDTGGTTDMSVLAATADVGLEFDGANLFGAIHWQRMETTAGDYDDFGVVLQGGFFVTDIVELFARYDAIFADSDRSLDGDFNTVTLGLNYYLIPESHAAKLTFDVQCFLDEQAASPVSASTTLGVLGSTDEQYNLRAQLQVMF